MAQSDVIGIDASRLAIDRKTGTETYTYQLLLALSKLDPEEQFRLYLNSARPPAGLPPLGTPVCIPFPRFWTHLRLSAELIRRPPSLLFVPAHVVPLRHPRSVVTIHDLGYLVHPGAHPAPDRRLLDLTTRWSIRAATRVIAVSEQTRADLVAHYGAPAEKIEVVHHGVSGALAPASPGEIAHVRQKLGLPERYLLALGTVQPRKNYGRLAQAVATIPNISLVIAGKRGWMAEQVEGEIAAVRADVRLLDYVDDRDLAALYSGATLFCQPSLYEGFGMPVLEAMACGTPVIASHTSSLPEIGGDAALYVDPNDPAAIAGAISRLLGDEDLRRSLVSRGRLRASIFTWERSARETLTVLRRALSGAVPAR